MRGTDLLWFLLWLGSGVVLYRGLWTQLVAINWGAARTAAKLLGPKVFSLTWPEPCSSERSVKAERNETYLKVILPGISKSGTTSVAQAMRDLGLRTYHIEEKMVFGQPLNWDEVPPHVWAKRASRCRLEVVSLEPHTDSLYTALLVSPEARVILTVRDYPSWKESARKSRGQTGKDIWWPKLYWKLGCAMRFFPWLHLWDALTGQFSRALREGDEFAGRGQGRASMYLLYQDLAVYSNPKMRTWTRGTYRVRPIVDGAIAEVNFLGLHNEVRMVTPRDRLLEFNVKKDGWDEITDFLGLPRRPPGTEFPNARNKDGWTNDAIIDNHHGMAFQVFVILSLVHLIHVAALSALVRQAVLRALRLYHHLRAGAARAERARQCKES